MKTEETKLKCGEPLSSHRVLVGKSRYFYSNCKDKEYEKHLEQWLKMDKVQATSECKHSGHCLQ